SLTGGGRCADDLEKIDRAARQPLERAEKVEPTLNKKPFGQFGFAFELGDFPGRETGRTHPLELIAGGGAPRANVRDSNEQDGGGLRRWLAETELRDCAEGVARRNPEQAVGLTVEAGRRESRGLQQFIAQRGRDFNRVELA